MPHDVGSALYLGWEAFLGLLDQTAPDFGEGRTPAAGRCGGAEVFATAGAQSVSVEYLTALATTDSASAIADGVQQVHHARRARGGHQTGCSGPAAPGRRGQVAPIAPGRRGYVAGDQRDLTGCRAHQVAEERQPAGPVLGGGET